MPKGRRLWTMMVLILVGAACSPNPRVRYIHEPIRDEAGLIKFHLAQTNVTLGLPAPASGDAKQTGVAMGLETLSIKTPEDVLGRLVIRASPAPGPHIYGIVPRDNLWLKTRLSATYFADTRLLKSAGTVVEDDRVKVISAVAGVARALIGLGIGPFTTPPKEGQLRVPVVIDVQKAIEQSKADWLPLPMNVGWWYRITATQPDKDPGLRDTLPREEFFAKYRNDGGATTHVLPLSACRIGDVHLHHHDGKPAASDEEGAARFTFVFADSRYVQTRALPPKGTITMHPVCGADTLSEKADTASGWALLEEFVKQVQSVKDAQDKTKKDQKPGG